MLGDYKQLFLLEPSVSHKPSSFVVHVALITVQTLFGAGSVIAALGLPSFNPLVFALIREACAGFILLVASVAYTGLWPTAALGQWRRFAILVRP